MNFLLHRHFAARELGRAGAGFGAMLPDLVRLVDRRWRPRRAAAPQDGEATGALADVMRGIEHHLEADVWFHRLEEFRRGERETAEAFRRAGTTARRLVLFAHATWEMLLDGAWVRRVGAARLDVTLREEAARFGAEGAVALGLHAASDGGVGIAPEATLLARLWEGLPGLATGYADAPGIARRLAGMRAAFGLPRPDDAELARWTAALASLEPLADESLALLEAARLRIEG